VSQALFQLIASQSADKIISIHNQESVAENELYQNKSGAFIAFLEQLQIDTNAFIASGKNSLTTYGDWLSAESPLILVHNTFSQKADIAYAQSRFGQLYFCLCPNANLYIENKLPDIEMLQAAHATICVGTDSLASNHQLSIFAEVLTIHQHYPQIGWADLLRWATYNGACALGMQERIGSIEVAKQPGIVWIKKDNTIQRLC
jgi:cytosine/adenosine deaminase-related metal-dependent hydrolase